MKPLALVNRRHPALHRAARPCRGERAVLAARMLLTLKAHGGWALAAQQVGYDVNLVVHHSGLVLCDVEVRPDERMQTRLEGCLTLPGRWFAVPRATTATVQGTDEQGQRVVLAVSDFEARGWQHEADHLAGLLISGRFEEVPNPERWTA